MIGYSIYFQEKIIHSFTTFIHSQHHSQHDWTQQYKTLQKTTNNN